MALSISLPPPEQRPPSAGPAPPTALLYFIPGNPGYIEYYRDFLVALRSVVDSRAPPSPALFRLHIYGRDLAGFQDDDGDHTLSGPGTAPPVDVAGQVAASGAALARLCAGGAYASVVLVGHSVGAFVALSLFRQARPPVAAGAAALPPLSHSVLLFPTIAHIARSPAGRVAAPLLWLGGGAPLEALAGHCARLLARAWPLRPGLQWFLGRGLGMEPAAAAVTMRFLASRDGVRQALALARDEMRVIGGEEEAVWGGDGSGGFWEGDINGGFWEGGGGSSSPLPRFFMLFGERDHWVDDGIRDEFIARTAGLGGVKAVVDDHGLPHAFCTTEFHSMVVAGLIGDWIVAIRDSLAERATEEEAAAAAAAAAPSAPPASPPPSTSPPRPRFDPVRSDLLNWW